MSSLTNDQMRKFIIDEISQLDKADVKDILRFCLQKLPGERFITSASGTHLRLDHTISDDLLRQLYDLVKSKIIFCDVAEDKEED